MKPHSYQQGLAIHREHQTPCLHVNPRLALSSLSRRMLEGKCLVPFHLHLPHRSNCEVLSILPFECLKHSLSFLLSSWRIPRHWAICNPQLLSLLLSSCPPYAVTRVGVYHRKTNWNKLLFCLGIFETHPFFCIRCQLCNFPRREKWKNLTLLLECLP